MLVLKLRCSNLTIAIPSQIQFYATWVQLQSISTFPIPSDYPEIYFNNQTLLSELPNSLYHQTFLENLLME